MQYYRGFGRRACLWEHKHARLVQDVARSVLSRAGRTSTCVYRPPASINCRAARGGPARHRSGRSCDFLPLHLMPPRAGPAAGRRAHMAGQDEAGRSATVSYKSGDAPEHTQRCNWLRLALRIGTRQQTPPGKWGRRVEGRYIGFEKAGKSCQKLKKSERDYNVQKTYRPF